MKATKFNLKDLVIIKISAPGNYDENEFGGDTWANQVCSAAPDFNAPDYDCGHSGIEVLIRRDNLDWWETSAKAIGSEIYTEIEPDADTHFGDANYSGVDLVSVPNSNTYVYWIE